MEPCSLATLNFVTVHSVSDGRRWGQYCIFFESVLAKKVRTDPAPAVIDPLRRALQSIFPASDENAKSWKCKSSYSLSWPFWSPVARSYRSQIHQVTAMAMPHLTS